MSVLECRAKFRNGLISKPDYIDAMYHLHASLFEYASFLKQTDISGIEIQDDCLILTSRSHGIKLICSSLDKRIAPIEILNLTSAVPTQFPEILNVGQVDVHRKFDTRPRPLRGYLDLPSQYSHRVQSFSPASPFLLRSQIWSPSRALRSLERYPS